MNRVIRVKLMQLSPTTFVPNFVVWSSKGLFNASPRPFFCCRMTTTWKGGTPKRDKDTGCLVFDDASDFRPNLTPKEILLGGSFGGTYFRDIKLEKTGKWYRNAWKEFESDGWFEGLDIARMVSSPIYHKEVNTYKVKCGQSLAEWESKGWIDPKYDSHGWFHWYCRFFKGRRCPDDERQIGRWKKVAGLTGRWRSNLIAKCVRAGKSWNDTSVSPVVRQTLQHWAYRLNKRDFERYAAKVRKGAKTSFIPQHTMKHVVEPDKGDEKAANKGTSKRKRTETQRSEINQDEEGPIASRVKRKKTEK